MRWLWNNLERDASEENEDKVRFQHFWESESFLTIQEEENLTNFIKKRNDSTRKYFENLKSNLSYFYLYRIKMPENLGSKIIVTR